MSQAGGVREARGGRGVPAAMGVLLACLMALIGFTCFLLYRVSRAVDSMARTTAKLGDRLDGIGGEVEKLAGSAASVSESVEKLADRVDRLSGKMEAADEWAEALTTPGGSLPEAEEKLIDGLLAAVRRSDLKFVRGGQEKSAWRMHAWLWAKYRLWKPTLRSAKGFIEKVATKEVVGDPYQVIAADGKKLPLADWLKEHLAELRAATKEKPIEKRK